MRPKSLSLFNLIRRMTPNEKRYFKCINSINNQEENKYMLLFDAINGQKEYDEDALLQNFNNCSFTNNFSEIKKYLYQQIKKSLRLYHSSNSINITFNNALSDLEILHKKGLYNDCLQLIKKTKKIALKYEAYPILLKLNQWKRKIITLGHESSGIIKYLKNDSLDDNNYIKHIVNESEYYLGELKILLEYRQKGKIAPEILSKNHFSEHPLTFQAKCNHIWLQYQISHEVDDDPQKTFKICQQEINLFEKHPHFIEQDPKQFLIALTNILQSCALTGNIKQFERYKDQVLNIIHKYDLDTGFKLKEILYTYVINIEINLQRGNKDCLIEAKKLLIDQYQITERQNLLDDSILLLVSFELLRSCIILEDYEQALEHYQQIEALNIKKHQEVILWTTRLTGLLLHYHFGNWIFLNSLFRSTLRLYKLKFSFDDNAGLIIECIRKCAFIQQSSTKDFSPVKTCYQGLLEGLKNTPIKSFRHRLHLFAWISAIAENRKPVESIKTIIQARKTF